MQNSQQWLIKSGDRILGPFSSEELTARLRDRELVLIDEVKLPGQRWRFIRDEPRLSSVVEEVRQQQAGMREDTEVGTASDTEPMDNETPTEKGTPTPAVAARTTQATAATRATEVRQYGFAGDQAVQKGLRSSQWAVWTLAAMLFVAAAAFFLRQQERGAGPTDKMVLEKVLARAREGERMGDWRLALSSYREVQRARPHDPNVSLRIAQLMLQVEPERVAEAARLFEEVAASDQATADERGRGRIGAGVAAMRALDWQGAETRLASFKAKELGEELWYLARFNLATTWFARRDLGRALNTFNELANSGSGENAHLLMAALAMAELGQDEPAIAALDRLLNGARGAADFRQEAWLLKASLAAKGGDWNVAQAAAREFLNTDPFLTIEHRHDPILYLDFLSWDRLLDRCKELAADLSGGKGRFVEAQLPKAVLAVCLAQKRDPQAVPIAEDMVRRRKNPGTLYAVQAFAFLQNGRELSQVTAALRAAAAPGDEELVALRDFVRGYLCRAEVDRACLLEAYKDLSGRAWAVSAMVGMGLAGDREDAHQQLDRIRDSSPRFMPAHLLERKLAGD